MKGRCTALLAIEILAITLLSSIVARPQESAVEKRAERVKTWSQLHQAFNRSSFDDGIVAEIYSEFVVHTLATKWSTIEKLQSIVAADPAFKRFVLEHIDQTTDRSDLRAVLRHAKQPGSRRTHHLRLAIAAAARRALAHP
jgi:hypothetical protein